MMRSTSSAVSGCAHISCAMLAKFQFLMKLANRTVAVIVAGRMRESEGLRDVSKKRPVGSGRDKTTATEKERAAPCPRDHQLHGLVAS